MTVSVVRWERLKMHFFERETEEDTWHVMRVRRAIDNRNRAANRECADERSTFFAFQRLMRNLNRATMSTPLNDAVAAGQAMKSSDRTGVPDTRLRGRRLILARVVCVAVVSLLVVSFLAMLPAYYTLLQTVCTGAACAFWQPTPGWALTMQKLGFSVSTYATIILALALAVAIVCFAVSTVIFWRKSDNWMALLVALGVVALGTVNVTNVLLVRHSS
jgi:hypothetical protein